MNIHKLLIPILFTLTEWTIVDSFIIKITFIQYIFVEIIVLLSLKLYTFVKEKYKL